MTAIDKLIQTADNEVGYLEKSSNSQLDDKTANAGMNNYTKYCRDFLNCTQIRKGAILLYLIIMGYLRIREL